MQRKKRKNLLKWYGNRNIILKYEIKQQWYININLNNAEQKIKKYKIKLGTNEKRRKKIL